MLKFAKYALLAFSLGSSLVLVTVLQSHTVLAVGEFTRSCSNIELQLDRILEADCITRNGNVAQTGINLNDYIVNDDGRLGWARNGRYAATSRNCDVEFVSGVTFLMCDSRKRDGSFTGSSLNLDEHIANIDGQLTYE